MSVVETVEERSAVPLHPDSAANPSAVRFRVLGPLEILRDGTDYAPTAPKVLQILALLALHPNRVVQLDSIVEELWGAHPPRSVRTTTQTYVYHLRRCIELNRLATDGEALLATKAPGYVLRIDRDQVDVFAFERLCREGREALAEQRHSAAAQVFRSALALWSGTPLANVTTGPLLSAHAVDLQEQRRSALRSRIEAEMRAGSHGDLIGELRGLVAANPLDEGLHGQLMRVFTRSGRRSEAMTTYRELRGRLNSDLGVEPCAELRQLHQELLTAGERIG